MSELNKHLLAEVKVRGIEVGVLSSFPMVKVEFSDVVINDVLDSLGKDRFVGVKNLGISFNVWDIIDGEYNVRKILIENGEINLRINSEGECNYIFWQESKDKSQAKGFEFALNSVEFRDINFSFRNDISRMFVKAKLDNAKAKGNFSDKLQNLNLTSDLSLDIFVFDKLRLAYPQRVLLDVEADNNTIKNYLNIKRANLNLSDMQFDLNGAYSYRDKDEINLVLTGKEIDLKEVLSIFGKDSQDVLKGYDSEGLVNFKMGIKGELCKEKLPEINAEFDITKGSLKNKKLNVFCEEINLKGAYSNGVDCNSKASVLRVDDFSFRLNNGFFEGKVLLKDFSNFEIKADVKTNLNLEDVKSILRDDSLMVLKGNLNANLIVEGKGVENLKIKGAVSIKDFGFKDLRLKQIVFDKTSLDLQIESLNKQGISVGGNVDRFWFNNILFENIKANVFYKDNIISSDDLSFKVFDGEVSSKDCKLIFEEKENVLNGVCVVRNLDIEKTFKGLNNFSQGVITDKNLSGVLSAKAILNLYFDKDFNFLSNLSSFNVDYSISKGRLKNFELMNKLSLFVEEEALKDVRFENISSSLQMNNSCINFEPIKVRSSLVDFECFGKHNLNNNIDYQFAINLSELSSRKRREKQREKESDEKASVRMKLFVKIAGVLDNPDFSFNLQSDMKKVKEKVNKDKKDIINSIDRDFKLNLEEAKRDKKDWEKQEKGEFLIEWGEEKDSVKSEKQFEDGDFIIEW